MTHAASKFWLGQVVYLKHDDEPAIIVGVLFEGDPSHPSLRYVLRWPNCGTTKHHEHELATEKNFIK